MHRMHAHHNAPALTLAALGYRKHFMGQAAAAATATAAAACGAAAAAAAA